MAWNEDGNWVRTTCTAYGTDGFSISDCIRYFAVAERFAARDSLQDLPDALLKIGAGA